jgi:hypothetical protein
MHCSAFLTEVTYITFNENLLIEPLNCLSLGAKLYFQKFRKEKVQNTECCSALCNIYLFYDKISLI